MRELVEGAIPYESQLEERACGAAALCMVYRSFGLDGSQSEIWERIARAGPWDQLRTNTRLLGADAIDCGLEALILKARDPCRVLELSLGTGIRIILNHRHSATSQAGHYSVFVSIDGEALVLHDPHWGPFRKLTWAELQELWRPTRGATEITGHVLVAFANAPAKWQCTIPGGRASRRAGIPGGSDGASPSQNHDIPHGGLECELCQANTPESVSCVSCQKAIVLRPGDVLGCVNATCRARTWEQVFCPNCDMGLHDVTGRRANFRAWERFATRYAAE
jgi:hypothetical protein